MKRRREEERECENFLYIKKVINKDSIDFKRIIKEDYKPGIVAHVWGPSPMETEARWPWVWDQPELPGQNVSWNPKMKQKNILKNFMTASETN
jgi:hypothetical protein